jgi:FPC/CPF motif-containing protein YcgG
VADASPGPVLAATHAALRAFVDHSAYPCVGAKSTLSQGSYRLGNYGPLGSAVAVDAAARDVQWFAAAAEGIDARFATLLTVFDGPGITSEVHFEKLLWQQLQEMHRLDAEVFGWDPRVKRDPADPDFSFSMGGEGFFIVGMHPAASRDARKFPYPTLVWNLHSQFDRLREQGRYERMKHAIRRRDEQLQGAPNPELADHGSDSEARQYSGRRHPAGWTAPFTACPFAGGGPGQGGGGGG